MPLNARHIGITVAVICFFGLSFISWLSGLAPFSCCKRALTGAVVAYIATSLATKAINTILINAMIESQQNQDSRNARPEQEGTVR